jgi:hypothetical protein
VSGWPRRYKPANAFLWECRYKRLELAQLLGQLGVFLTLSVKSVIGCSWLAPLTLTARAGNRRF